MSEKTAKICSVPFSEEDNKQQALLCSFGQETHAESWEKNHQENPHAFSRKRTMHMPILQVLFVWWSCAFQVQRSGVSNSVMGWLILLYEFPTFIL